MSRKKYNISVKHGDRIVEILFTGTSTPFSSVKKALLEVREYIKTGYRVKVKGYMYKESKVLQAFIFALDLVGMENVIIFENKSRYSKSKRKTLKRKAISLRKSGMTVKQISQELHVPLKTVYRWVKEENINIR
ncbi:MAG: hypothetical protein DRJ38_05575 [Thermoprotei archaeon]|nr:MAG: hypothetical protein DRJ38_05575 [Thermoprotei archaeon]